MNTRIGAGALITAAALLLTGCASSQMMTVRPGKPRSPSTAMTPGMVMPDGSTMGARSPATRSITGGPSAAEKMICAADTRSDIVKVLGLNAAPTSSSTWHNQRYTCTYTLPMGTFIVSVKRSPDPAAAKSYFASLRGTLAGTQTLQGLGEASYGTRAGKVVLIKDNDTLMVDAARLPEVFGAQQSKRFDFAYEIASDILGCWTGE